MKYIISLLVFLLVWVSSFVSVWNTVSASSIFNNTTNEIPYCKSGDCWVDEWIDAVKDINELAKSTDAATYVTGVVKYLIWFVYLIAVILIIYAWFNILTGVWDEEKAKKSKTMILYVVIWILLIFLAWPIVDFIMNMLNAK
jgi:hypothetical protein